MLVQSAIHFALDYLIQNACRYFKLSISSNKVWGIFVLAEITLKVLKRGSVFPHTPQPMQLAFQVRHLREFLVWLHQTEIQFSSMRLCNHFQRGRGPIHPMLPQPAQQHVQYRVSPLNQFFF